MNSKKTTTPKGNGLETTHQEYKSLPVTKAQQERYTAQFEKYLKLAGLTQKEIIAKANKERGFDFLKEDNLSKFKSPAHPTFFPNQEQLECIAEILRIPASKLYVNYKYPAETISVQEAMERLLYSITELNLHLTKMGDALDLSKSSELLTLVTSWCREQNNYISMSEKHNRIKAICNNLDRYVIYSNQLVSWSDFFMEMLSSQYDYDRGTAFDGNLDSEDIHYVKPTEAEAQKAIKGYILFGEQFETERECMIDNGEIPQEISQDEFRVKSWIVYQWHKKEVKRIMQENDMENMAARTCQQNDRTEAVQQAVLFNEGASDLYFCLHALCRYFNLCKRDGETDRCIF